MDLYKKHYLKYDTSYFDQFIGNEKWKTKIGCPQMNLPHHYGIIGQYDNINKYEGFIDGGKSQNGEDGILKYIFDTIGVHNKYYVEFGAGDGIWLSNSYYFRNKEMWNGLLLEGNIESVNKGSKNINLHHERVTPDNINILFDKYNVPKQFDLLSIDIDSIDYYVWKALEGYEPNVVIVETNPGLPNDIPLIMDPSMKSTINTSYFGANLLAFYDLAQEKGYEFVTTVRWNAIFVKKDIFEKLGIPHVSRDTCINMYFKPSNYWISLIKNSSHTHPNWLTLK